MQYIDAIKDAVAQLFEGRLTVGNMMVLGGCLLLVVGLVQIIRFFCGFRRQREKLFKELRDG